MHGLTKLFVALAAVLSVALAALTMAYTVNADAIVSGLQSARAEAQTANAALNSSEGEHATRMSAVKSQMNSLAGQLQDARQETDQLRDELARVQGELASAQRARTAVENQLAVFGQGFETQSKLIATLNSENTGLRESDLRSRRESLELADQLNDAEGRFQVAIQTIRNQELVISDLRQEIQGRSGNAGVAGRGMPNAGGFSGSVRAVTPGSEETLIEVDVGSNEGVSAGTELFIVRGQTFVGAIRIIQSDLNASVGRVERVAPGQSVRPGDRVMPRPR